RPEERVECPGLELQMVVADLDTLARAASAEQTYEDASSDIPASFDAAEGLLRQSLDEHLAPVDRSPSCSVSSPTVFLNHFNDRNLCKLDLVIMTDNEDKQVKAEKVHFGLWLQLRVGWVHCSLLEAIPLAQEPLGTSHIQTRAVSYASDDVIWF
ncbi:hypothetical protein STEG23_007551, partial [Scotinomys teguina]